MMHRLGKAALVVLLTIGVGTSVARAESTAALAERMLPRAQNVGTVESVEVVSTSIGAAQLVLDPQAQPESSNAGPAASSLEQAAGPATPADLVVMHGQFVDTLAKTPPGAASPTGSIMAFTINSHTGYVVETYVGNRSPGAEVGDILLKMSVSSGAVKASRARPARRHRRARAATWGNKCSASENHHCYALAIWEMTGGEEVQGTESEQYTTQMDVPDWEQGDFVSNEEWSDFFNSPVKNLYWTEIGQEGGNHYNCCSLHWFYAYKNHSGYHQAEPSEQWEITFSTWAVYYMEAAGGGVWCFDVGEYGEYQIKCVGGFETYSKYLQDGAEMADEAQPTNAGEVEANGWWVPSGQPNQWVRANNILYNKETGTTSYNGMCIAPYTPWNWPGNIYYGSYGNCP